jgi:cobalt-zinc-cadmium resistance protein CzcA
VINRLVRAALAQPLLTGLAVAALIGVGLWSFSRLPVDAYPDLSPPMVEIITQWPGRATEEVERLITVPVEVAMNGIPNLKVVRSISLYGLSDVNKPSSGWATPRSPPACPRRCRPSQPRLDSSTATT